MRSVFAAIVICLSCVGLSRADPAAPNAKLSVDVPPQALETALQAYTRETGLHIVYISEDVQSRRSEGVVGKLTVDEALTRILSGTGLTYRFLDAHTISIVPAGSNARSPSEGKVQASPVVKPSGKSNTASNDDVPGTRNSRSFGISPSVSRPTDAALLQAVVVTAERRRENAQTVPIAITALDQRAIREDHIQSTVDLQQFVPSLVVSGLFTPNDGIFAIRGESETGRNVGGGPGGGPSVVAYFADVPTSAAGPGLFYDLENVQVLKGPQGTLFGRNTTAGAILFEPKRPSKLFEGYGQITRGNYNDAEYEGAVNLPIVNDKLMLRVSGLRMSREGYTKDVGPYFAGKNYGNIDSWSGRVSLLFTPSEALENYLVASFIDWKDNGPGTVVIGVNPSKAAAQHPALLTYLAEAQALGPRRTSLDTNGFDVFKNYSVIDHFTIHFNDDYLVRNIVSYSRQTQNNARDDDGMPVPLLDSLGADPGRWHMAPVTVTEELQAQGKSLGERLQWQAGAYYEHVSDSSENFAQRQNFDTADLHLDNEDFQSWSRALYAQATYDLGSLVSGLKFTAGYRYTWDSLMVGVSEGPGYLLPAPGRACFLQRAGTVYPNCTLTEGTTHAGDSWVLGLDYQVSHDTFAYLTSRHGYKSGGFNILSAAVGGAANPFFNYKPETDTDVEIGVKTDWSLGRMRARTNIDAFYTMYNDAQVTIAEQITTGQIQGVTQNAAEARLKGVELEGILVPWDALSLNVSYSYNDGAYDRFYSPAAGDLSGTPIQYMPRNKFNVGARYTMPVRADLGNVAVRADYSWQNRYFRSGTVLDPFAYIPAYSLLNVGLDWNDIGRSGVDVSLWVANATNTLYRLSNEPLYTSAFGFSTTTYGPPRMYGGTLRYRF